MAPFVAILIRMAIPDTPPIVKLLGAIKEYAEKDTKRDERKVYKMHLIMVKY